jgi:AraC-like DNA-binding protein
MRLQLPGDRLVHLRQPVLLVYRHPRGVTLPHTTPPGARETVVSVNISTQSLARLLGSESKIPPSLFPMIDPARSSLLPVALLPMTPAMFDLTRGLIANRMADALSLVRIESMATQLLCVALESMAEERTDRAGRLHTPVPLAMSKARDLVRGDLQAGWTLRSVARTVGVCETRLKRDFKNFYGETLGSYSTRIRMEHALALLQRGGTSITRVALAVGYRHPTSFAKAFGRHFGVSPRAGRL